MRSSTTVWASLMTVAFVAPLVLAGGALPVDPIVNGDFELYLETTGTGGYTDGALYWSQASSADNYFSNAVFVDHDGDGDREAVVAGDNAGGNHNFWQSLVPPLQVVTANFDAFEWTLEDGTIAPGANNQIGLALTPAYMQHPFAGIFWEGAVLFRATDMVPDANGRVSLDPATDGEIACPAWPPCFEFRDAFDAADEDGRRALLGQARIVQVSFWNFNRQPGGIAVIDDVSLVGATTVAEELAALNANPNPCVEACLE